jgi:hypothetical protein
MQEKRRNDGREKQPSTTPEEVVQDRSHVKEKSYTPKVCEEPLDFPKYYPVTFSTAGHSY